MTVTINLIYLIHPHGFSFCNEFQNYVKLFIQQKISEEKLVVLLIAFTSETSRKTSCSIIGIITEIEHCGKFGKMQMLST